MTTENQIPYSYAIRLRLLGNEIFAIELAAADTSNRLLAAGLVTVFCLLTVLGAYGDKFIKLYQDLIGS